ncbi:Phospholipase D1 [Golovinomyces cichoracearum]|uniref:phospholipase D n=1 Tax=Golovinomyces cichoracearum TaxID=62708 RepID=A0A420IU98_9PEZI|nr:Phospholipase D1 [Golovinomyces cichoracearum]
MAAPHIDIRVSHPTCCAEDSVKVKMVHSFKKLKKKFHRSIFQRAMVKLIHQKHKLGKFGNLVNPNHRHDDEHEKLTDRKRSKFTENHRFGSFFPERLGNDVQSYIDGESYFYAVSLSLENAKETIYIADWWLTPELYLRRPPDLNKDWRLDKILKRKAEAGVKIFVIVYREVEAVININSAHTKHALQRLCPKGSKGHGNIIVMRYPDHSVFENVADMTFYWAHHEKFIVIDYSLAFIGGLDLCFGRWDDHNHCLTDTYPSNSSHKLWPGQDFNNNRIMDFRNLDDWEYNQLDETKYGRMPWHDVSMGVTGDCVYDIAEHFVLRWNFIKRDKYKHNKKYDWLMLEGRNGLDEDLIGVQRPTYPMGDYVQHPLTPLREKSFGVLPGTVNVQVIRSSSDWSSGILTEHSIKNAYCKLINDAKHYIYIENQFFITATGQHQSPIKNTIGAAIVEAVVRANREKRKFRVIVVMPCIPAFPRDLRDDTAVGTRAIMNYQYESICRGPNSIYERLRSQGIDPAEYIFFFNLRSYGRLNNKSEARTRIFSSSEISPDISKTSKIQKLNLHKNLDENLDEDLNPKTETGNWIQEELYVHSKILIIDDETCICGSANINDRSQLGCHDSELGIVITDTRKINITMDGIPFKAGYHAASLRRCLWREHLGLQTHPILNPDKCSKTKLTHKNFDLNEAPEDEFLVDPFNNKLWDMWTANATKNTEIFRQLFHADPDNCVKTFEDYENFLPYDTTRFGHIYDESIPKTEIESKLNQINGHLVWMPLDFLKDEVMVEPGLQFNGWTECIYT